MLERFSRKKSAKQEQSVWHNAQVAIQAHEDEKRAQFREAVIKAQEYMLANEAVKPAEVAVQPEPVVVASLGFAAENTPIVETKTKKRSSGKIRHGFKRLRRRLAKYELAGGITALTLSPVAAPLAPLPISAETTAQAGSETTTPSATRQARVVDAPSATGVGSAELDNAVRGIASRERNTAVSTSAAVEPVAQTPAETSTKVPTGSNSSPSTESLDNASQGVDMAAEQAQEAAKTLGIDENDQVSKNVGAQLTAARNAIASARAEDNQEEKPHVHDENCPEDHNYHPSTTVPKTSTTISTTSTTVYTPTTHTYPPKTTTTSTTPDVKPTTTTSTTVDTPDVTVVIPSTTSTTPTTAFVPSTTSTTEVSIPQTSTTSTTPTSAFVVTSTTEAPTTTTTQPQEEKPLPQRVLARTGYGGAALLNFAGGLIFAGDALNVLARKKDEKDLVNA